MKKIFFSLVTLLALFVSSCTNDDILIDTALPEHAVTINVNTQNLYDEFNITNLIKDRFLRDKAYAVGVITLMYNQEGVLADSVCSYIYNMNSIAQKFPKVKEGSYTVVTVETLVYVDNKYKPFDWRLTNIKNLSTLQLKLVDDPYWYAVLGVSSQTITVAGDKSIQVTPTPLGTIVNCYFFNFDKSNLATVGVSTNETFEAYCLNPALPESDRYVYDLTQSGYLHVIGSKSVEEDELRFDLYVLPPTFNYSFCYQFENMVSEHKWYTFKERTETLAAKKQVYAGFAYLNDEDGSVAQYFGDWSGLTDWYSELNFGNQGGGNQSGEVLPALYTTWGGSVSAVQSFMRGYTMNIGTTGKAVLQNDGSYLLEYAGKGKEQAIWYEFSTATTGLYEAYVWYLKSDVNIQDVKNSVLKSYNFFMTDDDGDDWYASEDFQTIVIVYATQSYIVVQVVDVNLLTGGQTRSATVSPEQLRRLKASKSHAPKTISSASIKQQGSALKSVRVISEYDHNPQKGFQSIK